MKSFLFASLFAVSFLAGCAAEPGSDEGVDQNDVTSRPTIELASSADPGSIQVKLYTLLSTLKGDASLGIESAIESPALTISGAEARAITCTESRLVHATVGQGVTTTKFDSCTLEGFDKVRNGGQLPSVVVKAEGEQALASKLVALLAKGAEKGGLGVKRSGGVKPPCCDMATTTTYTISDDSAELSCTTHAGGFIGIVSEQCTYSLNDANAKKPE
jgi:hypothetical protein